MLVYRRGHGLGGTSPGLQPNKDTSSLTFIRHCAHCLWGGLLGALLSGCGTIRSKEDGQMGHPYSWITRTAEDLECYVVVGSFMLFITAIIYLFDFPLSLLADTLILPVDLLTEVQEPRATATWVGHC